MAEQRTSAWLAAWRRAALDHLPRYRKDAPWLVILAAQAEANPALARRMATVEVTTQATSPREQGMKGLSIKAL